MSLCVVLLKSVKYCISKKWHSGDQHPIFRGVRKNEKMSFKYTDLYKVIVITTIMITMSSEVSRWTPNISNLPKP